MPTYGYRCTVCAHEFERFQKMSDAPVAECESCGQPVKRILYPAGIQFKGSGFYVTDYKGNGEGSSKKSSAESNGSGDYGSSSSTSTESKSDSGTKTETKSDAAKPAATAGTGEK